MEEETLEDENISDDGISADDLFLEWIDLCQTKV